MFIQSLDFIISPGCNVTIFENNECETLYEGYWIQCKRSPYWEVVNLIALRDGTLRIDIYDHSKFYEKQQIL